MTNATIALEEAAVLEPPQPDKKRKKMDRSGTTPRVTAFRYALLIFSLAMVLIPVYVLLITSFKGSAEADPSRTWFLPEVWQTQNWVRAWEALKAPIGRTFLLVIPSSIISAFIISVNLIGISSSLLYPRQVVRFPCGSASTNKTFFPSFARATPNESVVVVFPTPPFWFAIAITFVSCIFPSFF